MLKPFFLASAALFSVAAAADAPPEAVRAGFDHQVFSDEFNALDLSPDGGGNHKWFNNLWYKKPSAPADFEVHDGFVTLHGSRGTYGGGATLTTWPREPDGTPTLFNQGYFEARMRFKADGMNWPAFWLVAADRTKYSVNDDKFAWCELDIFEGGMPDDFQGTAHSWIGQKTTQNDHNHYHLPAGTDLNDWHTYGLLWQPTTLTWFFDNKPVLSAPVPGICRDQKMFLVLSSSHRKGNAPNASFDVDWVHAYR